MDPEGPPGLKEGGQALASSLAEKEVEAADRVPVAAEGDFSKGRDGLAGVRSVKPKLASSPNGQERRALERKFNLHPDAIHSVPDGGDMSLGAAREARNRDGDIVWRRHRIARYRPGAR
jgi:hypothetical protein